MPDVFACSGFPSPVRRRRAGGFPVPDHGWRRLGLSPAMVPPRRHRRRPMPRRRSACLGRAGDPRQFADLAARLLPAVVNVSTTETVKPGDDDGSRMVTARMRRRSRISPKGRLREIFPIS
jgi:S1-C subfamily serine protease